MYIRNDDFSNIKVGDIVAYDIGNFLSETGKDITLVKVLDITVRKPYYDYMFNEYEDQAPLVKYEDIYTGLIGECDIGWLFTEVDVINQWALHKGKPMTEKLEMIKNKFESLI